MTDRYPGLNREEMGKVMNYLDKTEKDKSGRPWSHNIFRYARLSTSRINFFPINITFMQGSVKYEAKTPFAPHKAYWHTISMLEREDGSILDENSKWLKLQKARAAIYGPSALAMAYKVTGVVKESHYTLNEKALKYIEMGVKKRFMPALFWKAHYIKNGYGGAMPYAPAAISLLKKVIESSFYDDFIGIRPVHSQKFISTSVQVINNRPPEDELADFYQNGLGTPQDYERAYILYSISAAKGHEFSATSRDNVAKKLTNEEIIRAKSIVKKCWKAVSKCPDLLPD
jgi:hypothetical protein